MGSEDLATLDLAALQQLRITAASRTSEKVTEAPATVYVITKQDIRTRGYSTLADVLHDLPGMEVEDYYYSEQGTEIPVRGVVGNNKIVLLINGMRVNPPGGEELPIRNDISVRGAEQIEVVYGPGSTLYGQDAISAVINIKTKQLGRDRVEASAAYGLYNTQDGFAQLGTVLREDTETPIYVTGYASYYHSDLSNLKKEYPDWYNPRYVPQLQAEGRPLDPTRFDNGVNAFLRAESRNASIQFWYRESSRSSTEGSGEGATPNPVLYFSEDAKWRDRAFVAEGQHALELSSTVTLHSILTFNRYEAAPDSRYSFPQPNAAYPGLPPISTGFRLFQLDKKYALGTSEQIEEKLDWEVQEGTHLMAGLVGTHYDVIPKVSVLGGADANGDIVSQAGVQTYYTTQGDPTSAVGIHRAVDWHYENIGGYVEGNHRFLTHFKALAGVRVDANTRYKQVPVSPRAALIYDGLDERLTLKGIFSMAYVAPAPYYENNVFFNGVQISSPNPNLQPEQSVSGELNATWQDKNLLASLSGYYNHQSNLLITAQSENPETVASPRPACDAVPLAQRATDPACQIWADVGGGAANAAPAILRHSINLGSSDAKGFDLFGRYNIGPITPGGMSFATWASYSYVDFSQTLGAVTTGLPQISRHNVRLGVTWSIIKNLSVTPSLVLRSTPEGLDGPTYVKTPGLSLNTPYQINANALYAPLDWLDVFLTGRNLTNNHYALRGVSGPQPQEPLTAILGARIRY